MPDAERARLLAQIGVGVVIILLYALGGLSLYLRSRFLDPTPDQRPQTLITPTVTAAVQQPELTLVVSPSATYRPSATLYPTITPLGPAPQ